MYAHEQETYHEPPVPLHEREEIIRLETQLINAREHPRTRL